MTRYPAGASAAQYEARFHSDHHVDLWRREEVSHDKLQRAVADLLVHVLDEEGITVSAEGALKMVDLGLLFSDEDAIEDAGVKLECWPSLDTWVEQRTEAEIEMALDSKSGGAL